MFTKLLQIILLSIYLSIYAGCVTHNHKACFVLEGCQVCTSESEPAYPIPVLDPAVITPWVEIDGNACKGPVTFGPPFRTDPPSTESVPFTGHMGYFEWVEINGTRHPVTWSSKAMARKQQLENWTRNSSQP